MITFHRRWAWASAGVIGLVALAAAPAVAQTLPEALEELLANHRKIRAAEFDVAAANEKAKEALGDWYPRLDITTSYGYERTIKENAARDTRDTNMPPREATAKITQLLWDFGATNATIDAARLVFEQAQSSYEGVRQTVTLEGIAAYLDLIRRRRMLEFARGSEDNIKRQTELEDARVQRGSGFSTDVLQAKQQLAGAIALRVRAEGALQQAINRYVAVFYKAPERVEAMRPPRTPFEQLPTSIEAVLDTALKDNPNLRAARLAADIARSNVTKTKADKFGPKINLVGEASHKNDFDGTVGEKQEKSVKVEMKYDFNLGLTAINTLKASENTLSAVEHRYGDAYDTISEQAKNAWRDLETTRQTAEHLRNQTDLASEFLELARKERQLGRRSLIDLLAAETSLINASSDAASAETDLAVAVYRLLAIMGSLSIEHVQ